MADTLPQTNTNADTDKKPTSPERLSILLQKYIENKYTTDKMMEELKRQDISVDLKTLQKKLETAT